MKGTTGNGSTTRRALPRASGRGVSVGGCADVRSSGGATPADPCPTWDFSLNAGCWGADTNSWISSGQILHADLDTNWKLLKQVEADAGSMAEQNRLGASVKKILASHADLITEPADTWSGIQDEIQNMAGVEAIIAWMQNANCKLDEVQDAIRKYKFKPPSPVEPYVPDGGVHPDYRPAGGAAKPVTQTIGEGTLVVIAAALAAAGVYFYARRRAVGVASSPGRALPPVSVRQVS